MEKEKKTTKKTNEKKDIIELIEDSLGGVSGGRLSYNYTNVDNANHFKDYGKQKSKNKKAREKI